jgi:hypothetical protein
LWRSDLFDPRLGRNRVDDCRDIVSKTLSNIASRGVRVFDGVVKSSRIDQRRIIVTETPKR